MSVFCHGFDESRVCGFLDAYFGGKQKGGMWWELQRELKMLHVVYTGMGAGFKFEMPPPRENITVQVNEEDMDGQKLRELAIKLYELMK